MNLTTKLAAVTSAAALAIVASAGATPAVASDTVQEFFSERIWGASCSVPGTANCLIQMYNGVDWIWGVKTKNIYIAGYSRVYECKTWGIPQGTRLDASGVTAKLAADHNQVKTATGTSWAGLRVMVAYQGGEPSWVRCDVASKQQK